MTKKLDARNIDDKITINLAVFCSIMRGLVMPIFPASFYAA